MSDDLIKRAEEAAAHAPNRDLLFALAARIRELEAAQGVALEALKPFASHVDKRTCKITMIWEDGAYRSIYTDTLKPSDFFAAATARSALTHAPVTDEVSDEITELREIVADLIQGARRDRSLLSPKAGPLHVIDTSVTKGQVMRAIRALAGQGGE